MKMRKKSLITPVILSALIPTLLLSGCGGGDDDSASNGSNDPATGPVVEQAPVSARDGFETIAPNTPGFVDLTSLVQSGSDGAIITDITLVSSQGSGQCGEVTTDNISSLQGFNVTIDGAAICQYSYEVESIAAEPQARMRASARVMVASSAGGSAVLVPISVPLAINDTHVTDIEAALGMDFPAGYSLSSDFSVLGDGDVTADTSAMSISYTATAEGVSRVVYALEGNIAGTPDIKMGTIDYAVSDELNNAPTANSFTFNEQTELFIVYDIDVSAYVEDAVDSDTLQLIAVSSYTADVAAKDNNDLSNKVFTFEASSYGMHYVSYTVSDHRGGFATGIVEIAIADPDTINFWDDIEDGLLTFSAPLTRIEADSIGVVYPGYYKDTNYYPGVDVVAFDSSAGIGYCSSRGGRIPAKEELRAIIDKFQPSDNLNWPLARRYLAYDGLNIKAYNIITGNARDSEDNLFFVTCVSNGDIFVTADKLVVAASGIDVANITVNFQRDGEPVAGAGFIVEVSGSAVLNQTNVTTSADGVAIITVSNTVAETVNVSFTYATNQADMLVASKSVDFISDIDTAQVDALQVLSDMSPNDGIDQNLFQVSVVDNDGNAIEGALVDVSLSSTTAQMFGEAEDLLTDENGLLIFGVTNTLAESVDVEVSLTSLVNGYSSLSVTSEFLDATAIIITPDTFTRSDAFAFCSTMSMRPATQSEYRDYLDQGKVLNEDTYWETGEQRPSNIYYPYFTVADPESHNGAQNKVLKGVMCVPTTNSGLVDVSIDNGMSTFESLSVDTVANGVDTADFKITLLDKYGTPAEGEVVYFAVNGSAVVTEVQVTTDVDGVAQVHVTDVVAEDVVVQALYNGISSSAATFIADVSTADVAYSTFTTLVNNAVGDGEEEDKFLFSLKDAKGNGVEGETVSFTSTASASYPPSAVTDHNGEIVFAATSTEFGVGELVATYQGSSITTSMTFTDVTHTYNVLYMDETPWMYANGNDIYRFSIQIQQGMGTNTSNVTPPYTLTMGGASCDPGVITEVTSPSHYRTFEMTCRQALPPDYRSRYDVSRGDRWTNGLWIDFGRGSNVITSGSAVFKANYSWRCTDYYTVAQCS